MYSDGATIQRADTLDRNPDHPVNGYDETAREKGLIGGACGYFANSSGTDDALDEPGADLIGGCGDTVRMQVT